MCGRVLDEATREPIAGAVVTYHNGCALCQPRRCTSRADGVFELEGVPIGTEVRISAVAPDHAVTTSRFVLRRVASPAPIRVDVLVSRGTLVRYQVVDFVTRAPLDAVTVRQTQAPGLDPIETDANGRFAVAIEWPHSGLHLDKPGYCRLDVTPAEAGSAQEGEVLVPLLRSCAVGGRVRDADGRPVIGAIVRMSQSFADVHELTRSLARKRESHPLAALPPSCHLHDEAARIRATTDDRGRFLIAHGVMPWTDSYSISVFRRGELAHHERVATTPAPGETLEQDVFLPIPTVREAGTIVGRVLLNGRPAAGSVNWRGTGCGGTCDLDDEGAFRAHDVLAGEVELFAVLRSIGTRVRMPDSEQRVDVLPGRESRCEFHFWLPMTQVSGRVRRPDGRPARDTAVIISGSGGFGSCATNSDGTFEFDIFEGDDESVALGAGSLRIEVGAGNGRCTRSRLRPNGQPIEFVVPELACVMLRVLDRATAEPIHEFKLFWKQSDDAQFIPDRSDVFATDSDGWFPIPFPIGCIDVEVRADRFRYARARRERIHVPRDGVVYVTIEMVRE